MLETYEYMRSNPILNIILLYFLGLFYCIIGTIVIGVLELFMGESMFGDGKFIAVLLWPIILIIAIAFTIIIAPIYICYVIYAKITDY
jgi:hypothetical protein